MNILQSLSSTRGVWYTPVCILIFAPFLLTSGDTISIRSGLMEMELAVPSGGETGTRFDPASMVIGARWNGISLVGMYKRPEFPETNSGIGLAEEYCPGQGGVVPSGFDSVEIGGLFLKIPIGALLKDSILYSNWKTARIVRRGKWTVKSGGDWMGTTWESPAVNGLSCVLSRITRVDSGGFSVERVLSNVGSVCIDVEMYGHNFFCIGGRPIGLGYELRLGFPPRVKRGSLPVIVRGGVMELGELSMLRKTTDAAFAELLMPMDGDEARSVVLIQRDVGISVLVEQSRRPDRMSIFISREVFCPESFIRLSVPPGARVEWGTRFTIERIGVR